ncbi:hypothetical protein HYH02_012976 [Chlamydomonas schloesseri]|uniref:Uncharacterized protein n=1 Tax=Chlamydomonas schloesseri TaxID=2026947 RepID=A0A835T4N5_9CHLO|nr:hypothetical protein HYH02_012976 [Chlamydomonas schloesseri]|eukprot:KAG2432405.1 hypothetical protein HYH02_012976 [Chlamydomonas schloesseri]
MPEAGPLAESRGSRREAAGAAEAERLRALLLARNPNACVARELWCTSSGTYSAYRELLHARKQLAAAARAGAEGASAAALRAAAAPHTLPATVKYSFEGVKHVLAESTSPVSALAFAALRNDLLAYGCTDGDLWLVLLPAAGAHTQPVCSKARRMHGQAIQSLDWTYDNSQLLSVGADASLCVWDVADPGAEPNCIRSISCPATSFLCGRFHRVNFSLAMVGTSRGALEIWNSNTGMQHSRYQLAPEKSGVAVTAIECSNHHVFVGDSTGTLHLYTCELKERQLSRLRPAFRLRLALPGSSSSSSGSSNGSGGGGGGSSVTTLQYVPFCRATDSPVLLAALQDGSLCVVKANEVRHTAELYLRRWVPPPSAAALPANALGGGGSGGTAGGSSSSASITPSGPSFSARPHPPAPSASPATAAAAAARSAAAAAAAAAALLRLRPAICPLSPIHDVPLITYGSDDTSVYIVDVSARSFSAGAGAGGRGGGGGAGGTAAAAGAAAAAAAGQDRPMTVTVLKAHRAAVTAVSWSYDEALLASADAVGTLVLWQRCRLF